MNQHETHTISFGFDSKCGFFSPPAEARLRCSLWRREDTLEERRLEAEETLEGLRHRVDQLDSLLASPDLVM